MKSSESYIDFWVFRNNVIVQTSWSCGTDLRRKDQPTSIDSNDLGGHDIELSVKFGDDSEDEAWDENEAL